MCDPSKRYLCDVIPVHLYKNNYRLWANLSKVVCPIVSGSFLLFFKACHRYHVHPSPHHLDDLMEQHRGRPILTVSNHMSCLDDPMIWSVLYRYRRIALKWGEIRWTPGAQEILFSKGPALGLFMSFGKAVSCVRGAGIYQPVMDFCVDRLNAGDPVHIFVEGKVNADRDLIRPKWGVGRLVQDCQKPPIVIPFIHKGMEDILPLNTVIPRPFKRLTAVIGKPIDMGPVLESCERHNFTRPTTRKCVTDLIQSELEHLNVTANDLHYGS